MPVTKKEREREREKNVPVMFLLVVGNVEFTHNKCNLNNWKWQRAVSGSVRGCQRGDVNFFDVFLSG